MLTNKSDVYSFGIVLMEILTGQSQLYITQKVSLKVVSFIELFSFRSCSYKKNSLQSNNWQFF
jgi:serine/threonine protein kinase